MMLVAPEAASSRDAFLAEIAGTIASVIGAIAKAIPSEWIRGIFNRHPGFNIEGTWYSELPSQVVRDRASGRKVENFLTIKQHGVLLKGTMRKHVTEPGKAPEDEEFEFHGRVREGLIYGYVEPKPGSKRFGAAALVYQIVGDGNKLKGGQAFWDIDKNKIQTVENREWQRMPKTS
jgi:hypothetical protein